MPEGEVRWFSWKRGYGFIASPAWPKDIFFHASAVRQAGIARLEPGMRVAFTLEEDARRPGRVIARNLKILSPAS